ncbi:hypothetical protein ACEPAH_5257 [Sanghuangporus vaninii]
METVGQDSRLRHFQKPDELLMLILIQISCLMMGVLSDWVTKLFLARSPGSSDHKVYHPPLLLYLTGSMRAALLWAQAAL